MLIKTQAGNMAYLKKCPYQHWLDQNSEGQIFA